MDALGTTGTVVLVTVIVLLFFKILKAPLKLAFKILLNTCIGFAALILINYIGGFIGVSVGINWVNAAVVGIFGLPGAALLLILQWLFLI